MWLLSYEWQHPNCSESGRGWDWDGNLETFNDEARLAEALQKLLAEITEESARWEKQDPKWREPKFIPPYRNIKTYGLTPIERVLP